MNRKPRRAWFQIHLSTAIAMMLLSSGLLWANVRTSAFHQMYEHGENDAHVPTMARGWPMVFEMEPEEAYKYHAFAARFNQFEWRNVLINFGVCLGVIVVVGTIMEFHLRRREARTP